MRPDRLRAATDAIRLNDHRNTPAGAVAGLGAALAVGGMEWLSVASHYSLVIIYSAGCKADRASGKAIAVSRLGILGSIL
jgi:hypothetical protein